MGWIRLEAALLAGAFTPEAEGFVASGVRLMGRLHPLLVHFPLALLFYALWRDLRRCARRGIVPAAEVLRCLRAAALTGVLAAAAGWAAGVSEGGSSEDAALLNRHRWWGVGTTALLWASAAVGTWARRTERPGTKRLFRGTLWAAAVAALGAGHGGGTLVYGEGYFTSALPGRTPPAPVPKAAPAAAPERVDFVRDVAPLLKKHCISCHGPRKQKGKLRLDRKDLAFKGGVSGRVILPGNARDSLLYTLLLDPDPDARMPEKADPLPADQIEIFRRWIDEGAVWPDGASVLEPAGSGK
jgi:uncharacterized membrane protein